MAEKDCGGYENSESGKHLTFITNHGVGNGLPIVSEGSNIACTMEEDIYDEVQGKLVSTVLCPECVTQLSSQGHFSGDCPKMCQYVTTTNQKVWRGTTTSVVGGVQLKPFYANIEADIKTFYRKVGNETHLIAQLTNVSSYLIRHDMGVGQVSYGTSCYLQYRGFAFTVSVSLEADPPAGSWKYCLGGWRTAPCHACNTGNCNGMNIGGYFYNWGDKTVDAPFANSKYTGRFNAGPYEWDLGPVFTVKGSVLYIAIAPTVGMDNCESQQRDGEIRDTLGITPPPLNICPPEVTGMRQDRDICENCAITLFDIAPNDLLGNSRGVLVVEYVQAPAGSTPDWSQAQVANYDIYKDRAITNAQFPCLDGGKHYFYRMKIKIDGSVASESEYVYGEFDTLFIPPPNMTVPDITEAECTDIDAGNLIPPFEEVVCYGGCK